MGIEIVVPKWMAERIKKEAAERGLSAEEMFEELLSKGLEIAQDIQTQRTV